MNLAGPAGLEDVVLPSLVNEIAALPRPVVLALDDYYLITNPVLHATVTYLLDHQPDTLQVAIGTRAEPALPLGRLRVQGELAEVRADQLRFTAAEAEHLLNLTAGPGLAADDVDQAFLTFTLIYILLPALMVALSLVLPPRVNRMANVVVSLVYGLSIVVSIIGEEWAYYILGSIVEVVLLVAIARSAWRWPAPQSAPSLP